MNNLWDEIADQVEHRMIQESKNYPTVSWVTAGGGGVLCFYGK